MMNYIQVDTQPILELNRKWAKVALRIIEAKTFPETSRIMAEESAPLLREIRNLVSKTFFGE